MTFLRIFTVLSVLLTSFSVFAEDEAPIPKNQVVYNATLGLRWNALGVGALSSFEYRRRLFESSSAALRDNYIGFALDPSITGADGRLGARLIFQPLSVLQIWGRASMAGYFGAFNNIQSFQTVDADWSDTRLYELGDLPGDDPKGDYATPARWLEAGAKFQIKFGPVAIRDSVRFVNGFALLREGDKYHYDQALDSLLENNGWAVTNDADLLYLTDFDLIVGARYSLTHVFYSETPGLTQPVMQQRAGPLVAYQFLKDVNPKVENLTVLGLLNWWITHPNRTGTDSHQGIPYILVALQVNGDLLKR